MEQEEQGRLFAAHYLIRVTTLYSQDIMAVAYSEFDFTKAKSGLACCWSLKNPEVCLILEASSLVTPACSFPSGYTKRTPA